MKKPKSLETKLRSAVRLIWSRSAERRAIIKESVQTDPEKGKFFICPLCHENYPDWAGEVDHITAVGPLSNWRDIESFIDKMFYSPQRLICKTCHRTKTKEDRRKMK
jgi:hypothetical protein